MPHYNEQDKGIKIKFWGRQTRRTRKPGSFGGGKCFFRCFSCELRRIDPRYLQSQFCIAHSASRRASCVACTMFFQSPKGDLCHLRNAWERRMLFSAL